MPPQSEERDLLIRLGEQMVYAKDETSKHSSLLIKLHEKMDQIIIQLHDKADRNDVVELRDIIAKKADQEQHNQLRERVALIEGNKAVEAAKKETVINMGKITWKTWLGITGSIITILTILNAIAQQPH